MFLRTD